MYITICIFLCTAKFKILYPSYNDKNIDFAPRKLWARNSWYPFYGARRSKCVLFELFEHASTKGRGRTWKRARIILFCKTTRKESGIYLLVRSCEAFIRRSDRTNIRRKQIRKEILEGSSYGRGRDGKRGGRGGE